MVFQERVDVRLHGIDLVHHKVPIVEGQAVDLLLVLSWRVDTLILVFHHFNRRVQEELLGRW